jgi:hypothetical protein
VGDVVGCRNCDRLLEVWAHRYEVGSLCWSLHATCPLASNQDRINAGFETQHADQLISELCLRRGR